MKFEELQRQWDSIKSEPKTHDELRRMMYASPVWRFRGISRKEIWGLCWNGLVVIALIIVFDVFSDWFSIMIVLLGMIDGLDHYLGLRYLRFLPQKDTIQDTLTNALVLIKRMGIISRVANVLIWISLAFRLGAKVAIDIGIGIGTMNTVLWALLLVPALAVFIWWNSRTWSKKSDEIKALLKEFTQETDVVVA